MPVPITIEFAAMRFLVQWYHKEKLLHAGIRQPTPAEDDIHAALRFFQIARNFRGVRERRQLRKIRDALCRHRTSVAHSPVEKVERLAAAFNSAGFQRNVSAASKLLWLSSRSPFKIYDDRARKALIKLGEEPGAKGDYARYFKAWEQQFEFHRAEIRFAASRLSSLRAFLPRPVPSEAEVHALAGHTWFQERVFDIYLWELGDEG